MAFMTHVLTRLYRALCAFTLLFAGSLAQADDYNGIAHAELRTGWRMADGTHMAALHIVLNPGWKTYWRAPGDVGIPPRLTWGGSRNVANVAPRWPAPVVFFEQGMRSVGYKNELIIPLAVEPRGAGSVRVKGKMELGVCKDICIPAHLAFDAELPGTVTRPDPQIAAALADLPFTAREAGVRRATCKISPAPGGGVAVHAAIDMPALGGREFVVLETGNPHVWVAEPDSQRKGGTLHASTQMVHVEGKGFVLDRSRIRITVIGGNKAVDIRGCTG